MMSTLGSSAPVGRLLKATRCSMMNKALHMMARVIAICTAIKIAPTLLRRMAEMMGPNSMVVPLLCFELPRGLNLRGTPGGIQAGKRGSNHSQDHCNGDVRGTKVRETAH